MQRWPLLIIVLLLVAALPLTACGPAAEPAAQAAEPPSAPVEPPAIPVQVATVQTGDVNVVFSYTGDIQAAHTVNLLPGAAGRIESVQVQVGDQLKAGDPIAAVEIQLYAAQLKQAEANLELAKLSLTKMEEGTRPEQIAATQAAVQFARNAVADLNNISDDERTAAAAALAQAEAGLRLAQSEYDKVAWAGQVGMLPQALALEQATTAYEAAKAAYDLQTNPSDLQLSPLMVQLAQAELALALAKKPYTDTDFGMARARIEQAEAALEMANVQVEEATIRAPFDGVVAELYITEGSMVGPQAPVALFVSQQVEAVFNVEESRIGQVKDGQSAALRVATYPGQDFPGVVTSIAPVADKDSHTFIVKVTPVDGDNLLRSGMYADLSLLVEQKEATLLVPRSAVSDSQGDGQQVVYVLQDDATVRRQPVTIGLEQADSDRLEILSGLSAGQQVVIAGQGSLEDGVKVEVRE